jgi:hypothetical protein
MNERSPSEIMRDLMKVKASEVSSPKAEAQLGLDNLSAKATLEMPAQESLADAMSVNDFSLDDMRAPSIFSNDDTDSHVGRDPTPVRESSSTAPGTSLIIDP